jgi:hypothetical protein
MANAAVSKSKEYKSDFMRQAVQGFGALYYMLDSKKAQ